MVKAWKKWNNWMSFRHLLFTTEHNTFCIFKHTVKVIFVAGRAPWSIKQLTGFMQRASFTPNAAPVSTKGRSFPHRTKDQVEEEWHVLLFTMLIYAALYLNCKNRFEHCWARLWASGLLPSVSCTIQTKCFNFAQHTMSFIFIIGGKPHSHV